MGWDDSDTNFSAASQAIHNTCEFYKVPQPEIKLHTTRALPWSCPERGVISLQRDKYLNVPISLHEATHHVVWHKFGTRVQDHGPTFLGVYLDLLKTNGFDMYDSARAYGLKWRDVKRTTKG